MFSRPNPFWKNWHNFSPRPILNLFLQHCCIYNFNYYICNIVAFISIDMANITITHKADWAGIVSSTLCTIHCLLTPVLLAFQVSTWHLSFMGYVLLFLSFCAVFHVTMHAPRKAIKSLLWIGFLGLAIGILFEEDFIWAEASNYIGSTMLIIGHFWHLHDSRKKIIAS
jgi:MerC mercury resistance protein